MADKTRWIGTLWGTNHGTLIAEFTREGDGAEGDIQLFEPGIGQTGIHFTGAWNNTDKITGKLDRFTGNHVTPLTLPQSGEMDCQYDSGQEIIVGEWKTDIGTNGKFVLAKSESPQISSLLGVQQLQPSQPQAQPSQPPVVQVLPPQVPPPFVTKTKVLSSYRLDQDALRKLAELVKSGTNVAIPVINAALDGREFIHIGVDSLIADPSVPAIVYDIRVVANEPVLRQGNNTVMVTLKKNEPNTLFVSGYDRVWVEGKAAQLEHFLEHHESKAANILRRYGTNLNSIIFLLMLAFLPSVPLLRDRLKVIASVFVLLFLLLYSWRGAANTKVFLREPQIAWYQKNAGWLLVLLEVALAAWIAYLTQKYLHHP